MNNLPPGVSDLDIEEQQGDETDWTAEETATALSEITNRQERLKAQQQYIFARMTPEAVSDLLVNIASDILYQQESGMGAERYDIDIIHLRQIADWLESKQEAGKQ